MSDRVEDMGASYLTGDAGSVVPEGYKQTEVGVIPEDWEVVALNEVATFGGGTTPSRTLHDRYYRSGVHPWIKTLDLNNGVIRQTEELVTDAALSETSLKKHKKGSVLVAMYGGFNQIGRTGLTVVESAINQALVAVCPDKKVLSSSYLLSNLNYNVNYWKSVASSSRKDPNITSGDVKAYSIPLPCKKEQTAIANALSDVDALISEQEKLIAKKQAIKTATMQQLLTGRTRLPQFALREDGTVKGYKQSELGEVPEDWEVVALKNIARVNGGKRLPKGELLTDLPTDHPYVRVADMVEGGVCLDDVRYVPSSIAPLIKNYRIFSGEIFISVAGSLGIVGQITRNLDGANLTENADRISSINADVKFILYSLMSKRIQDEIDSQRTVGAQPKLALGKIELFMILLPRLKQEQAAISSVLTDMDRCIDTLKDRLTKIRQIKQGMMQELLTGKTRLLKPEQTQ